MARGYDSYAGHSNKVLWSAPSLSYPSSAFTLAAKGYPLQADTDGSCLFCLTSQSAGHWAAIAYDTSTHANGRWQFQAWDGSLAQNTLDDTDWVDGKWFSLVGRQHSNVWHEFDILRLDTGRTHNDNDNTSTLNWQYSTWKLVQGNNDSSYGYDRGWDGYWAETAYWNVALTDAEVEAYQDGYAPLLIRPENLLFYDPGVAVLRPDQIAGGTGAETGTVESFPHPPGIIYKE